MSARHHTPAYRRNARIIRQRVRGQHRLGQDATCWRGGGPIPPGMPYDVGHRDAEGGDVIRRNLRVAAANGDDRAGVLALDAADGLPGLAPALGGHGAGVDDDDVRALALPRRDHAAGF